MYNRRNADTSPSIVAACASSATQENGTKLCPDLVYRMRDTTRIWVAPANPSRVFEISLLPRGIGVLLKHYFVHKCFDVQLKYFVTKVSAKYLCKTKRVCQSVLNSFELCLGLGC